MVAIAPSILGADLMQLGRELKKIEDSGAEYIHIDVMDGHFVPNLSFGIDTVRQVKANTHLPVDVHLMLDNPEHYIEKFAKAGADLISIHLESTPHISRLIKSIKDYGCKAGVVLNPGTSAILLQPILADVDYILQMTCNPGLGGQSFLYSTLSNIEYLAKWRKENHASYLIEVDGGINDKVALDCRNVGVDILVAGSFFFNSPSPLMAVKALKGIAN